MASEFIIIIVKAIYVRFSIWGAASIQSRLKGEVKGKWDREKKKKKKGKSIIPAVAVVYFHH